MTIRRGVGGLVTALALAGRALAGDHAAVVAARGWTYVVDKVVADGIPRERAEAVFADPRFDAFDGLDFSLTVREPSSMYRRHMSGVSVARARRCYQTHGDALAAAEKRHGVPANVVAAILQVESACGANSGHHPILPRLARLAMANEPDNLARNVARHQRDRSDGSAAEIAARTRARAVYLENTFYPEVVATFRMSERMRIDPLSIRGSYSGAFGLPQFLPTSYLRHGADGNGDGVVDLYDPSDAIASCARYLADHGWHPGISLAAQRSVVWTYNRSSAYIDAVLALADRITSPDPPQAASAPCGRRGAARAQPKGRKARATKVARNTRQAPSSKAKSAPSSRKR